MQYGLIGEKLGHSYSREIHEMLGRYSYELKELAREDLPAFLEGRDFCGLNVTIPYKETVMPFLDEIDDRARRIGCVNTIVNRNGRLIGYNTDFDGMLAALRKTGAEFEGMRVLILGTGGTAKTAYAVLKELKAGEIRFASRRKEQAFCPELTVTYDEAETELTETEFIVNTTPCGMYPKTDGMAIDPARFPKLYGTFDVVYNPTGTRFVQRTKELGKPSVGGLTMLVGQAVSAAEKFLNEPIPTDAAKTVEAAIRMRNTNLVLTGMPGAGKSTVGKLLAERLNMGFVDTDELIVEREHREITDIFRDDGEVYFRDVEQAVIRDVSLCRHTVIATGGGAVLRRDNVLALKEYGTVVFLNRAPETLVPTEDRPLADNKEKMARLYRERLPIYRATADLEIDGSIGTDAEVGRIAEYFEMGCEGLTK